MHRLSPFENSVADSNLGAIFPSPGKLRLRMGKKTTRNTSRLNEANQKPPHARNTSRLNEANQKPPHTHTRKVHYKIPRL